MSLLLILNEVTPTEGEMAVANTGIWIAFILFYLAIFILIAVPLVTTVMHNPKSMIPLLGALGILAVIYGIGYGIAPDEISAIAKSKGLSDGSFKAVGGALMMMAILSILAILSFIADTVLSILK